MTPRKVDFGGVGPATNDEADCNSSDDTLEQDTDDDMRDTSTPRKRQRLSPDKAMKERMNELRALNLAASPDDLSIKLVDTRLEKMSKTWNRWTVLSTDECRDMAKVIAFLHKCHALEVVGNWVEATAAVAGKCEKMSLKNIAEKSHQAKPWCFNRLEFFDPTG